jgi:hypothetical protein
MEFSLRLIVNPAIAKLPNGSCSLVALWLRRACCAWKGMEKVHSVARHLLGNDWEPGGALTEVSVWGIWLHEVKA